MWRNIAHIKTTESNIDDTTIANVCPMNSWTLAANEGGESWGRVEFDVRLWIVISGVEALGLTWTPTTTGGGSEVKKLGSEFEARAIIVIVGVAGAARWV